LNYLEIENNDLHFANESDFKKMVVILDKKSIPYQIFGNDDDDGYYEKFVIIDKANKAFLSLKITIVDATIENLEKVKIKTEIKRLERLFDDMIIIRKNTPFNFSVIDDFIAYTIGSIKKEMSFMNELLGNEK
jgi:hypothetical protein